MGGNDRASSGGTEPASAELFSGLASTWIERYETRRSFRARLDLMSRKVAELSRDDGLILDFGGGAGVLSALVSDRCLAVVCLDPSAEMIGEGARSPERLERLAQRHGRRYDRTSVLRVVGTVDCLVPREYDLVLAVAVIEYLHDPLDVLGRLLNMLSDRGVLLMTLPDRASAFRRVESVTGRFAAGLGTRLGIRALADRAYVQAWPGQPSLDWLDLVARSTARLLWHEGIPLGDGWLRRRIHPSRLIALSRPTGASSG